MNNNKSFEDLNSKLYDSIFSGQRLYYTDIDVQDTHVTLFNVRQRIDYTFLHKLKNVEYDYQNKIDVPTYMSIICNRLQEWSLKHDDLTFDEVFDKWPASPFEEWVSEQHTNFWISCQYFSDSDQYGTSDYALLLSVKSAITSDIEQYKHEYGSALTLTKLSMFND